MNFSSCGTWALQLWLPGSGATGSVVAAHRLSFSEACGIFPDQGSNPGLLPRQADSLPLSHQGSPENLLMPVLHLFFFPLSFSIYVVSVNHIKV